MERKEEQKENAELELQNSREVEADHNVCHLTIASNDSPEVYDCLSRGRINEDIMYEEEAVVSTDKVWHTKVSTSAQGVSVKCSQDSGRDLNGISQALFELVKDANGIVITHDSGINIIGATDKLSKSVKQ